MPQLQCRLSSRFPNLRCLTKKRKKEEAGQKRRKTEEAGQKKRKKIPATTLIAGLSMLHSVSWYFLWPKNKLKRGKKLTPKSGKTLI